MVVREDIESIRDNQEIATLSPVCSGGTLVQVKRGDDRTGNVMQPGVSWDP